MSLEQAKLFWEKVKQDSDFLQQLNQCRDAAARMTFAREAGFTFTAAEMQEVSSELDSEELDLVVGGITTHGCKPTGVTTRNSSGTTIYQMNG